MSSGIDRRQFMNQTAWGGAVLGLALNGASAAENSPSRKVVVGVMGLSRGKSLAQSFARKPGVEVRYVCDVDQDRAGGGVEAVQQVGTQTPKAIGDFRRILDDPEVDALICAAPNHWHAPATILACAAGKHVYVEKPCSHNPREGELMIEAARKHKRAVQVGTQRRSAPHYHEAIALLRDGVIGRPYCARGYYNSARGTIGTGKRAEVPSNLDYELWQGPAPRTPYVDNRIHYNWHWLWHWGNGELGNNGVHSLDICRWAMGVDYPIRVTSSGGRYAFEDDQQTPDTHCVAYEFEGNKAITWQGLSCNRFNQNAFVTVYGDKGTLELHGNGSYVVYDERAKEVKKSASNQGDQEHIVDFLDAIRNDKPLDLNCDVAEGHKSTLMCHLGNIAHRTGRTLNCSPKNGHILGDEKAMALWSREYESGWEPVV
jgi:predicted dehydrogenase